jgi:hypothetical protein
MSYQIRKSDGSLLIDLPVGEIDVNATSLTLIGKNVSNFGELQNQNMVRMVENWAATYPPGNPLAGQLWFNTVSNQLNVRKTDGTFATLGPFSAASTPAITDSSTTAATTQFVHNILPAGTIVMWYGSIATIPNGWHLCDGSAANGYITPDLRDKFVMGAGQNYAPKATGGTANITSVVAHNHSFTSKTANNDTSHNHGGTTASAGNHYHGMPGDDQLAFANGVSGWTAESIGGFGYDARSVSGGGGQIWKTTTAGSHNHTFTTGNESAAHAHAIDGDTSITGSSTVGILNPYYALAYIMKVV